MTHDSDIRVVAQTLWGEARGEGERGIHAVANVIVNRVRRPCWWGADFESVCRKPWQFSCWNEKDPNRAKMEAVTTEDRSYWTCADIAERAVSGCLADITGGATHYHVIGLHPAWEKELTETARIGRHVFYR
jgi:N-acetylmuramoyl-L-alanine amidase